MKLSFSFLIVVCSIFLTSSCDKLNEGYLVEITNNSEHTLDFCRTPSDEEDIDCEHVTQVGPIQTVKPPLQFTFNQFYTLKGYTVPDGELYYELFFFADKEIDGNKFEVIVN